VIAPVSIHGIADWLHPAAGVHKALAMLQAYFDESWTQPQNQGVAAIAGYVATKDVWAAIEKPWADQLKLYEAQGLKTFHAAHCCGDIGYEEFALIDTFHRMSILSNLSGLLENADVQPIWSAVYTEDWNDTVTDPDFLARFPDPFCLCFEHVTWQLANWTRRKANGERVAPMFARQKQYEPWMSLALDGHGKHSDVLGSIAFGYPSQVVPLQAADLLAHEISWEWDRAGYNPPKTLAEFGIRLLLHKATAYNGMHEGGCFDASSLVSAIDRFKRTGSVL
jgi:hypothetical protein